MKKRLLALMLAVTMTVSFAACGEKEEVTTEQKQEFVYVAQDMSFGEETYDYMDIKGMSRGIILGVSSSYDADTGVSVQNIIKYNVKENTTQQVDFSFPDETASEEDVYRSEYINAVAIGADSELAVLTNCYIMEGENSTNTYQVYFLDTQGQITQTIPLDALRKLYEDEEYFYVNNIVLDNDGTLYVVMEESVAAVDRDGTVLFCIETGNWIQSSGDMPDGSVYVTYYGDNGNVFSVIDKASKAFGSKYELGTQNINGFFTIEDGCIYYNDDNAVCKLNLETGETEKLLEWLDADIDGDYIRGVQYIDADTIAAYFHDWSNDDHGFIKLVKTDSSLVTQKETVILAALTNNDVSREEILAFNKSNDTCRIELKTYLDYTSMSDADWQNYEQFLSDAVTRMMNDITSKNAPDIIAVGDSNIDMSTLAKQGVLEELTPYLEQRGYSEEDFLEGVVNSFKQDGKLYTLPGRFGLQTMIANSAVIGEKSGWTLQEALEVINNLPEGMEFAEYMTQSYFVQMCLVYGYDTFIDKQNGTCNFDSDEFKAVLEMAKQFPSENNYDEERPSEPVLASNGEILTISHYISDLQDIQYAYAMFGDNPVTFIGFPGAVGNGTLLTASGSMYAICSKSEHKQEAAEFVLDSIIQPYDEEAWNEWGIPSMKKDYETYIAKKTHVEYLKDENGELLLDENGEPIVEGGTSGVGWGDWEYTYHPCTQEEADVLTAIIQGVEGRYNYDATLFNMITEEAEPFFQGQKSAEEAAAVIQNRISLYLSENN